MNSDLRRWITLVENAGLLRITPQFIRAVRAQCDHIASDIAEDLPPDDQQFAAKIREVIARIEQEEPLAPVMTVVRAELRPADTVPNGITGVGAHWAWSQEGARAYHHDNAYDEYGREDLAEITLVAEVRFASIDWPFTIATNLILPNEKEITIKSGATVALQDIYAGDKWFDTKGRKVGVSGFYRD